ncbi:MAG: DegT/DnrJ/EryC1/StrS aminotransferase family protein [Bryobacteraceae bacterium]|nr:DegT/DnrJ/EryC1/StrS aminotransferase family protein [Bryobacteraceae bacterium]
MIPFHRPLLGDDEINEVVHTLRSGWLTSGPKTAQFETEFAEYAGASRALAVNSCTAGLHLALAALDLGPGDEVITTPLTFCATINTILHCGATPVLADVRGDGNLDPSLVAERITRRTRAILPVHLAGLPCDMDAIWELARTHGLKVVEDAAHAVGSKTRDTMIGGASAQTGGRSDAVAFSFYATKNLTTGEGGMVTTHDAGLFDRMKVLCLHGISKDAWNRYSASGSWFYQVLEPGFKYNMSDIQASLGIHQLRKQEEFIGARRRIAKFYQDSFADLEEIEPASDRVEDRHSWHLYILKLRLETLRFGRDEFIARLKDRGVSTSVHFIPIPLHPAYRELAAEPRNHCPEAIKLYSRSLSLPLFPGLTEGELRRIVDAVRSVITEGRSVAAHAATA